MLEMPKAPELHRWGTGRWVIRFPLNGRTRNERLNTNDEMEANRQLKSFTKEWSKMDGIQINGAKSTEEQRAKWRDQAAKQRKRKGLKVRSKNHTIKGKEPGPGRADTQGGVVPSTALVPVSENPKAAYSREHYHKRKEDAEKGKASTEAVRRIEEHMGVLAANLEVAGRTLKMIRRMIDELGLDQ